MRRTLIGILIVAGMLLAGLTPTTAASAAPPNSRVMAYLNQISGSKTLSGQYNRQPNAQPALWTNQANTITGQWPAVWGSDFQFESAEIANRQTMINEAINQWNSGSLVTLSWHVCPPTMPEPCDYYSGVQSDLSNAQWTELITNGTTLNNAWKSRLDKIVPYLQQLKNAGVEVLWRPLHEINEQVFWWGNRQGANGSSRLFQITKDYLDSKGLTNLIYVWNVDLWTDPSTYPNYYPGANYVDVLSLDWYQDSAGNKFPTTAAYNAMVSLANGKPIALGEVGKVPTPAQLASQPRWAYWLVWAEYLTDQSWNTNSSIQATYFDYRTVNRAGLALPASSNSNLAQGKPVYASSTESASYPASAAVDNNNSTRWASAWTDSEWIYADLGSTRTINSVQLAWEAGYATQYQIQTSNNGSTWTTVYTDTAGGGGTKTIDLGSISARYVKMYAWQRATPYGYSLYEFKVFGP